jgi:hypothetical protein
MTYSIDCQVGFCYNAILMIRKDVRAATMPSLDGIDIPGVGMVATPPEKRGWFRRHSTGIRTTADGIAAAGVVAVQGLVTAKAGSVPTAIAEGLLIGTAQMGLATDAADRWVHRKEQSSEQGIIDPPEGTFIEDIGEVSTPQERSRGIGIIGAKVIYNVGYVVGVPTLAVLTASLARVRNIPEAIITGGAEVVLLSNLGRHKKILGRLDEIDVTIDTEQEE